jgi:hypothetical protein
MTTLADLKSKYSNKPVTLAAIDKAISDHGENAEAVMSSGLPSTSSKSSNMVKAAQSAGFDKWAYYCGARAGKNRNDGYYNVIVKIN